MQDDWMIKLVGGIFPEKWWIPPPWEFQSQTGSGALGNMV